jgi:hypothetical protein
MPNRVQLAAALSILAFSAVGAAPAVRADDETDWNSVVAAYYIADAVYDHCGFQLTSAEVAELNSSLEQAERESGLTSDELEALREDIAENADDNTAQFCATNGRYVRSSAVRQ